MQESKPKPPLPPEAIAALQQGRTIDAIKIIREVHGLSLLEAKQRAEAAQKDMPPASAQPKLIQSQSFARYLTPLAFSFGALGLLYQANGFLQARSNAAYCDTAQEGRFFVCKLSAELGEHTIGAGKGYVGSAIFLLLLGGLLSLLAWLSYRAIQTKRGNEP